MYCNEQQQSGLEVLRNQISAPFVGLSSHLSNPFHKSEWFSKAGSSSSSILVSLALFWSDLDSQNWAAMCNIARASAEMLAHLNVQSFNKLSMLLRHILL